MVKGLKVKPHTCNEVQSVVDLSRFDFVRKIDVGQHSLQNVELLMMNGLNKLNTFEMQEGSFNNTHKITVGSNSLNAMNSLNLQLFHAVNQVTVGEGSMNAVSSVLASGLTNLSHFTVHNSSLEQATE